MTKGSPKTGLLLKQKIPRWLTEWDTSKGSYLEIDLVLHCGSSILREYVDTFSTTEVSFRWWNGCGSVMCRLKRR